MRYGKLVVRRFMFRFRSKNDGVTELLTQLLFLFKGLDNVGLIFVLEILRSTAWMHAWIMNE